jgi:phospholipase/carboxylesterase
MVTRRSFVASAAVGLIAACTDATAPADLRLPAARLHSRWRPPYLRPFSGIQSLGLPDPYTGRDGLLYVPSSYQAKVESPLVVCLHGANGNGSTWTDPNWLDLLDEFHVVMVAPDSRSFGTWDLLDVGAYGPDVDFIDDAIEKVFRSHNIDSSRISIVGFSDGASEAIGLGLLNGDLFNGVVGFSPGMFDASFARGHTRAFLSHGTTDTVLSYDNTKDTLVPAIASLGVPVKFQSFIGGHGVPVSVMRAALNYSLTVL